MRIVIVDRITRAILLAFALGMLAHAASAIVLAKPESFVICVMPDGEPVTNASAATELKTHLDLVFGVNVPVVSSAGGEGVFVFSLNGDVSLPLEEARYRIQSSGVSFTGGLCGGVEFRSGRGPVGGDGR